MKRFKHIPALCGSSNAKYFSHAYCVITNIFFYVCNADSRDASSVNRHVTDNYDKIKAFLRVTPFFVFVINDLISCVFFSLWPLIVFPLKGAPILKINFALEICSTWPAWQICSGYVCFNSTSINKSK